MNSELTLAALIKEVLDEDHWEFYDEIYGEQQKLDFSDAVMRKLTRAHPAQLGSILLEIQAAKELRYLGGHPDYRNPINFLYFRERIPRGNAGKGRFHDIQSYYKIIKTKLIKLVSQR